jgi:hypothetical protein
MIKLVNYTPTVNASLSPESESQVHTQYALIKHKVEYSNQLTIEGVKQLRFTSIKVSLYVDTL